MLQLSKRLQAVANMVTTGNRVADIGCDHAYISIYLAENDISPHIVAMDVNQGPIDRAKENICRYGCEDKIETRKSDGLQKLIPGEVDTILIGGMGGALTIQILTNHKEVLLSAKELVLQPQSELYKVRKMLTEYNFLIIKEDMIKDDGKYYVILKAVPNINREDSSCYQLSKEEHYQYGRILLEHKNPLLYEFMLWDLDQCNEIVQSLTSHKVINSNREKEIKEKMDLIRRGLSYYKIDSKTDA